MNLKFKIQNSKLFVLLIVICSLFTVHCFAQRSVETYEIDGLNEVEIPSLQLATNLKSGMLNYDYLFPVATLTDGLYLNLNAGCKFGIWIDKSITSGVNSTGFVMIPVGLGLSFRKWNPVNISFLTGVMGGLKGDNLFTNVSNENPNSLFDGGFYVSGNIFFPLKNKLGMELSYNRIFIKPLNNFSYIGFGMIFGKYE